MAVNDFAVAKALIDHLKSSLPALTVVTQGESFAPTGGNYLREAVLPAMTSPMDRLTGTRQRGVYQIDVCTPKSAGKWSNMALVGSVKPVFVPATILSNEGQDVKIVSVSVSALVDDGAYWFTPVSVNFVAFG
jgi:hypothetical protein